MCKSVVVQEGMDSLARVLLHNGLLSTYCEKDMKKYINSSGCCRIMLITYFEIHHESNSVQFTADQHMCCEICAEICKFGKDTRPDL